MEETYLIYADDFNIIEKVHTEPTDKQYHKVIRKDISVLEDFIEIVKDFPGVNKISSIKEKEKSFGDRHYNYFYHISTQDEIGKMHFSFNIFDTTIFVLKYKTHYKFRTDDHKIGFRYNINSEVNSFNLLKRFKSIYKSQKIVKTFEDNLDCEYVYENEDGIEFKYNDLNYRLKDNEIVLLHREGEIYYSGNEERDLDKEIEYLQHLKERNTKNIKEIVKKLKI